jgi:two-component system chemotaxis response regulator CheB
MPQHPLPVIIVSALTERSKQVALDALSAGAVDIVNKPRADSGHHLEEMLQELGTKIRIAAGVDVSHWKHAQVRRRRISHSRPVLNRPRSKSATRMIAIGASTGGTEAILEVLSSFSNAMPGIVVVQHMPVGFTRLFAARLNSLCAMEVKEAEHGDLILPGRALIAPGALQLRVADGASGHRVELRAEPPVSGHCPSVDVMMHSVAATVGAAAIGVLLTGMGRDGAEGLKAMRQAGARTLAQDEATSVVFGMPRAAWEAGAAEQLVPLPEVGRAVLALLAAKG